MRVTVELTRKIHRKVELDVDFPLFRALYDQVYDYQTECLYRLDSDGTLITLFRFRSGDDPWSWEFRKTKGPIEVQVAVMAGTDRGKEPTTPSHELFAKAWAEFRTYVASVSALPRGLQTA